MKPIGPLMWEHRLIEKMLSLFEGATKKITEQNKVDPLFVDTAVDFIRTYADRTHHGKEEDILFRDLIKNNSPKNMPASWKSWLRSISMPEVNYIPAKAGSFVVGCKPTKDHHPF